MVSGHPWDGVPAPVKAAPPVRGRKPKAEQPAPEKAETPKAEKAARPAAPEKKSAARPSAAKKQKAPKIEAKEEQLMDDNKRTPGGRDRAPPQQDKDDRFQSLYSKDYFYYSY